MAEAETALPMPRRFWAVTSLSSGSVLYAMDANIANVTLPVISNALEVDRSTVVLLVSLYNLVLAMLLLPLAAVGEHLGHRKVFAAGLVGYIFSALACLLIDGFYALVAIRGIQAVSSAAILSVSLAMVRMTYPTRSLGRGLGLNTMMASLGAALAPPLSGLVLAASSWQPVFAIGVPLALLGLAAFKALPDTEPRHGPFDVRGAVLCAAAFGVTISSFQALGMGASLTPVAGGLIAGLLLLSIFIRHAIDTPLAVLPVDLLGEAALALSVVGGLLAVLSSTIVLLFLPFKLTELGFDSATIGAMLTPFAIAVLFAAPLSGMLSDRISSSVLGSIGMALALIGVTSLAFLPETISYLDIAWRMALCGIGFSAFFSPNGRLVVGTVTRNRAAGASSLLATTRMLGQALGSSAVAGLLTLETAIPAPEVAAIILALLALIASVARIVVQPAEFRSEL